jgi:2'-hydroxyisoflavone reductase
VRDAGQALHGKVGRYIFISTISVYAGDDKPGADETAPTQTFDGDPLAQRTAGPELYGPMKAASEKEAQRQFPGITTIIRPGLIVGPGDATDRFTYWPVRLARGGEIAAPGDGSDPLQFIDARDLAEWTVRMAEQRSIGVYNGAGPARPLTTRAMLEDVGRAVHSTGSLIWIPTTFLDAEKISAWSDMPVWVPGQGDTAGFARRDIRRAMEAGLTFRPLNTTAVDTLAWFRTLPAERQAKLKAGLTPEREQALLAKWKAGRATG